MSRAPDGYPPWLGSRLAGVGRHCGRRRCRARGAIPPIKHRPHSALTASRPPHDRLHQHVHPGSAAPPIKIGRRAAQPPAKRNGRGTLTPYPLRGRLRCSVCNRKMESSPRAHGIYYRCPARTLAPNSPVLTKHPAAVYIRETAICAPLNQWIAAIFDAQNRTRTIQTLVESRGGSSLTPKREHARRRLTNAEAKLRRHQ